ncbi:uncharacterized protein LOC62_07G008855 [Vanrija pseudolonga]|uniref:F-box domain-containing protein n=1 Tax=Vanrija pseudolonga TaxID=143232 RepID=A0AAF0YEJ6_9TREE|nr:hypothetical protein LOC62_07G008855 [Vanrija pseudolonga]
MAESTSLIPDDILLLVAEHLDVPELGVASAVCRDWASVLRSTIKNRIKPLKDPRDLSLELEATRALSLRGEVSWRALALAHALDAEMDAAWDKGRPTVRWVPVLGEVCSGWYSTTVDPYTGDTVASPSPMNGPDCWSRPIKPYTPPAGYEGYYTPHEEDQHDEAHGGDEPPLCSFTVDSKLQYHHVDPLPPHMVYVKPLRGMGPIAFCIYRPQADKGDHDGGEADEDGASEAESNADNSNEAEAGEDDAYENDADAHENENDNDADADEGEKDIGTCEVIIWVSARDWCRFSDGEPYEDPQYHGLCRLTSFQAPGNTSLSSDEFAFHLDYDADGIICLTAAWCFDEKVYLEELCYAKGRSREDRQPRGDNWALASENEYLSNAVVLDNDYVFVVLQAGDGVAVWQRHSISNGKGVVLIHTDQRRFFDKEMWFDLNSDAQAKRVTMGEWSLDPRAQSVPVTPGRAQSLMLQRVPWDEELAEQMDWNFYYYVEAESLAIAGRHLFWRGWQNFAVIPQYTELLREVFAGELDDDDRVGQLVASRVYRFHFERTPAGDAMVSVFDHRLACCTRFTSMIINLDDLPAVRSGSEPSPTACAVEITQGFSSPGWDQLLSITPRGVLQMVKLDELSVQDEYTQATKDFDPALKCRGGEEARQESLLGLQLLLGRVGRLWRAREPSPLVGMEWTEAAIVPQRQGGRRAAFASAIA